jgi:acyl-CoA reductase-like NAD-dependent aldehyde dehydrogenase
MNDSKYGLTASLWTKDPNALPGSAAISKPAPCS